MSQVKSLNLGGQVPHDIAIEVNMKASSLAPSLSIISHVAIGSEKKILKTYTQHQNNFIESTIKYVMYIIYLTIYVGVICINLMKTWAPLRVKIFLWLALRRAIGQEIGG